MSWIETFVTRPLRPGFVELLPESAIPDQYAAIDHCPHLWRRLLDGSLECQGPCAARLYGELACRPPKDGMDWSRAVLVRPEGGLS